MIPSVPKAGQSSHQLSNQSLKKTATIGRLSSQLAKAGQEIKDLRRLLVEAEEERDGVAEELEEAIKHIQGLMLALGVQAPHIDVTKLGDVMNFLAKNPASFERLNKNGADFSPVLRRRYAIKMRSPKSVIGGDYDVDKPQVKEDGRDAGK